MNTQIASIVEGHGEVHAVPLLIRRIASVCSPDAIVEPLRPMRVPRNRLMKPGEVERAVEFAARLSGPDGRILIVFDADGDCPKDLAAEVAERARSARGDRLIGVVIAKQEYEAWLIAAAESLAARRGLGGQIAAPPAPETIADAKGWLSDRMTAGRPYQPTLDQAALTALLDLTRARNRAPSFDKMWREVCALI